MDDKYRHGNECGVKCFGIPIRTVDALVETESLVS